MANEKEEVKGGSKFWWPNVSTPDAALATAKGTQFIAYWIGGSYLVLGYLGSLTSNLIIGIIIAALGVGIWRNILWLVPIIATIGIIEAGSKIVLVLMAGRANGLIVAGLILLYSIHGWRAWLALRAQRRNSQEEL